MRFFKFLLKHFYMWRGSENYREAIDRLFIFIDPMGYSKYKDISKKYYLKASEVK